VFDRFVKSSGISALRRPRHAIAPKPSKRSYEALSDLDYPFHDHTIRVTECGHIRLGKRKTNLSQAFAGQKVGFKEIEKKIWLVRFMQYDLGSVDNESGRIE
jgi:putative transposase